MQVVVVSFLLCCLSELVVYLLGFPLLTKVFSQPKDYDDLLEGRDNMSSSQNGRKTGSVESLHLKGQ